MRLLTVLSVVTFALVSQAKTREIPLHTELVEKVVTWMPSRIEVTPGEKIVFVVEHKLKGGFEFHGFAIPELAVLEQIDRDKPSRIDVTVPKELPPGEYKIGCQFHPAHAPATLVVLDPKAAKTPAPKAATPKAK